MGNCVKCDEIFSVNLDGDSPEKRLHWMEHNTDFVIKTDDKNEMKRWAMIANDIQLPDFHEKKKHLMAKLFDAMIA